MASKKKNQRNFTIDEINALDDFYYNFPLNKIVSKTDFDFSLAFFLDDADPRREEPFRFLLKLGGFNISLYVTKLYNDAIKKIMDDNSIENGVLTIPICSIGDIAYVAESMFINGSTSFIRNKYPENKFSNIEQQDAVLSLLNRSISAFPSTIRSAVITSFDLRKQIQTEKLEEYDYGAKIKYSPELLAQIANGELIR